MVEGIIIKPGVHGALAINQMQEGNKMKVGLVSCCKTKLTEPARAKDLYISDTFKKMRAYVESRYDDWAIMSAELGLVSPVDIIEPYDYTLIGQTKKIKQDWANRIFFEILTGWENDIEIHIFAGEDYRKYLIPLLEKAGYTVKVPLKGLGIGQQKAWLKKELSA